MSDREQFVGALTAVLRQLCLELNAAQVDELYGHYTLLMRWNRRMNLTSIKDPREIVLRHFGESLAVGKVIGPGEGSVVDIGSGGGFPGGPIAVLWPERFVTLVESAGKKAVFLKELARGCTNLGVYGGRIENFAARAEWVIARGVALSEIVGSVGRIADRVAVLVSGAKAGDAATELGLKEVEEHPVAWDNRTVVLMGRVGVAVGST